MKDRNETPLRRAMQEGMPQQQKPQQGYEDYEQRLQAIKPNNQYNYQVEKNPQIYRNHPEFANYPHMLAGAEAEASNQINQHLNANNLQGAFANANLMQQPGYTTAQQAQLEIMRQRNAQANQHLSYSQQQHQAWLQQQAIQKAALLAQQQQAQQQEQLPQQPQIDYSKVKLISGNNPNRAVDINDNNRSWFRENENSPWQQTNLYNQYNWLG